MFNWGQQYRIFAYINMAIVLTYFAREFIKECSLPKNSSYLYLLLIPLTFICTHFIAINDLVVNKEIRSLFLASFIFLGVILLSVGNKKYLESTIFIYALALIFIYVIGQAIAIVIWNRPYGTTKNPHYLALYSSIAIIVSIVCFIYSNLLQRILIGFCIVVLGAFLLHSSSRPAWIGLILSSFLVLFFLQKKSQKIASIILISLLLLLTFTNLGNFTNRFQELIVNIQTEERVVIWQDSWSMQRDSNCKEWVFGHGLDSFKENFKSYSHYHQQNVDFNSPHNFFLELLYISGVLGLFLVFITVTLIYTSLIAGLHKYSPYKEIYLMLLALITSNFLMVAITLPFFSSFNLNVIAVVAGIDIYLKKCVLMNINE